MHKTMDPNRTQRVVTIGLGNVGLASAATMIHRSSCFNLFLLDIKHGLQSSVVRDLNMAIIFTEFL